ncbi:hypothetical protein [Ginsengibacter hankyongi]|uniref:hypothetical protein n=1 Tax=Ginsengibacter hankyongi TaxID=2607284 RepID=UPI001F44BC79|nr:hypothetical protein [Ginsengibacter hankyongi]
MNIKNLTGSMDQIRCIVKGFIGKLTQNPEFYNIRHYTKSRYKSYNQKKTW